MPYPGPVLTQNQSTSRVAAAVALALIATAVLEHRPDAQGTGSTTWTVADVGSPAIRGSAQSNPNCSPGTGCPLFAVTGAGAGIGGAADQFTFLHQRLTGDGVVKVRMLSMAGPAGAEIGLMFRESLNRDSRHGSFMAGAGLTLRRRTTTGGTSAQTTAPRPGNPFWMKLERAGSTLTASTSLDGSQWSVIGTQTVPMQPILYVGIAITSRIARNASHRPGVEHGGRADDADPPGRLGVGRRRTCALSRRRRRILIRRSSA